MTREACHPAVVVSTAGLDTLDEYRRLIWRRRGLVALLLILALASALTDFVSGPSSLGVVDALRGLFDAGSLGRGQRVILWEVRLPIAVLAVLVGMALALAGVEMQTILGNPLAEPFTLGVSSSAALGAALAIVLGVGVPGFDLAWLVPANAFVFALGALLLLQLLARTHQAGPETLVLFGITIGFAAGALLSLLQFVASEDALQQLVFWTMGSLARADWTNVGLLTAVLVVTMPFSWRAARRLTALRLGDDRARSFGINVDRLRLWALVRASLLAATAVALVGTIGFVGLVGPHMARLLVGEDHRFLLPASVVCGALLMSLASVISKTLVPGVLMPVGIATSLVGLPVFLALLTRRHRRR